MNTAQLGPGHLSDIPHRSEADQAAFFDEMLQRARAAHEVGQPVSRRIAIAGLNIGLTFANAALADLMFPAIAHLEVSADDRPDYEILVWDSRSSGLTAPPAPVERRCLSDRGDIWSFHSRRFRSAFHYSEYSINVLDAERGLGVFWVQNGHDLPYWSLASPFRTLFHWILHAHGAQLLHAAAVGLNGQAILITGKGGVGKSSTALKCLEAGLDFLGDDYVVVRPLDGEVLVYSLYRTAKIALDQAPAFVRFNPRVIARTSDGVPEKAVIYCDGVHAGGLPVRLAVTPSFSDRPDTQLEPIDHSLLLGAAIYTTCAQLPHADAAVVDLIDRAISSVPGFTLSLGSNRAHVADGIRRALAEPLPAAAATTGKAWEPFVSVIIPVHNGAAFIADAVGGIIQQAYSKIEIIVVDDASTDNLREVVAALPIPVRLIHQQQAGPAAARNTGIQAASGDVIAFVDADDLWPEHKLRTGLDWLAGHPETDVVIGRAQLMEMNARGGFDYVGNPADSFSYYIGAALYRRSAFDRCGLFDVELRFGEDSDWFTRCEFRGVAIDRLDMVSLLVRRHPGNMTRNLTASELTPIKLYRNLLRLRAEKQSAG